uniref:Uncharacterized protein n=1 Tax=Rhizophora mucronata TaxID=61149 RepID=A0A2P2P1B3_RHIMU
MSMSYLFLPSRQLGDFNCCTIASNTLCPIYLARKTKWIKIATPSRDFRTIIIVDWRSLF